MRGFSKITDNERTGIIKQHSEVYDGYATGNVPSNMTPLTVYDAAQDKVGITVTNQGEVRQYTNHNVNEIAAKNLHYDEIDAAYNFDSHGPQQSMTQPNPGTKAYEFDSKGPADPYYYGGGQDDNSDTYNDTDEDEYNFKDLLDMGSYLDDEETNIDEINENVNKSLDMFKRFKNY